PKCSDALVTSPPRTRRKDSPARSSDSSWVRGSSFGASSSMSYEPIENYGIIGNMRTAALVSMKGSIDWLCVPHFDSPSVFAALIDDEKGGRFRISPIDDGVSYRQLYWLDTNVLVTRFLSQQGVGEIVDFMPVGITSGDDWHDQI